MTPAAWVAGSAVVEQWFTAGVVLGSLWLIWAARRRPAATAPLCGFTAPILAAIVLAATVLRVWGWSTEATLPWSFAEMTALMVDRMTQRGTLWSHWRGLAGTFQVGSTDASLVALPVFVVVQRLTDNAFHTAVLFGAVFGVAATAVAYGFGRTVHGNAFGLMFAALIATSPLQVVWSRIGALHGLTGVHLLTTMWIGYLAGARRSFLLAVLTAVAVWCSLYQYYAARVAIPLGLAALVAGAHATPRAGQSVLRVVLGVLLGVGLLWCLSGCEPSAWWPRYPGYLGNRHEASWLQVGREISEALGRNTALAVTAYFLDNRAGTEALGWGMQYGGLCLLPIAGLGALGLLRCLANVRRTWIWLALLIAGAAVPLLSVPTARRMLVWDVAWCGLAAHGALRLVQLCGHPRWSRPTVTAVALAIVVGWSSWVFATVVGLHALVPAGRFMPLPFAESGFGDGLTCRRCLDAGKAMADEFRQGHLVVLFDSDFDRENPSSPGGLYLYAQQAALVADRREQFLDAYPLLAHFEHRPPFAGVLSSTPSDLPSLIAQRAEATSNAEIVWWFETPTSWERGLVAALVGRGSRVTLFDTALSKGPGMLVRTPPAARTAALAVLRHHLGGDLPAPNDSCPLTLVSDQPLTAGVPVLAVSMLDATRWSVASWDGVSFDGQTLHPLPLPVGVTPISSGLDEYEAVTRDGVRWRFVADVAPRMYPWDRPSFPVGLGCAQYVGGAWWLLDAATGTIDRSDAARVDVTPRRWVGLARRGEQMVLAANDQSIHLIDVATGSSQSSFAAFVPPSTRVMAGECTPLAAGDDWIAVIDNETSRLVVYANDGRLRGVWALDQLFETPATVHPAFALAARGPELLIGSGARVRIFTLPADCP